MNVIKYYKIQNDDFYMYTIMNSIHINKIAKSEYKVGNILYEDDDNIITIESSINYNINVFRDIKNKNRYLFCINYYIDNIMHVGGIIMNNNVIVPVSSNILKYDYKDGIMTNNNAFFCNNVFMLIRSDRNTSCYILDFAFFEDITFLGSTFEYTDIKSSTYNLINNTIVFNEKDCINLDSFIRGIGKKFVYSIKNTINPLPCECIKCKNSICSFTYKINDKKYYLGEFVCTNCFLRYSKSSNNWKCIKIIGNTICSNVYYGNDCINTHDV